MKKEWQQIKSYLNETKEEIIRLRRVIHQNPEPSFEEYKTADLICTELNLIDGLTVSRPTATSVLAVLKGSRQGKTLAVRSDLDALRLEERNEIPYKSKNPGYMHACGHDGHAAMLVGAAKILSRFKDRIKGEIRFIFQHAEEKHPGGARELTALGILQGVDMIIAGHLWVTLETGTLGLKEGPVMAAPDNFDIIITGRGGHAGMPQDTIDPVLVSAQVITALQSLASRQVNPLQPLVLSVTGIEGRSAYNIIPEKVELKGTVRTLDSSLRENVPVMMEKIIEGICSAYGASYSFLYEKGYEPVINDKDMVAKLTRLFRETMGVNSVKEIAPVMVGEDFSEYLKKVPGVLIFIGAGNKEKGISYPHHHPYFNIDENALEIGTEALVQAAFTLLD